MRLVHNFNWILPILPRLGALYFHRTLAFNSANYGANDDYANERVNYPLPYISASLVGQIPGIPFDRSPGISSTPVRHCCGQIILRASSGQVPSNLLL